MPSITDSLRARGIGSGQGISQTDLTALIDVTNVAEANNDAIKLDVVNKLNSLNPALNLATAASWSTIRTAIASMQYRGAQTITPGPSDFTIPAGYHNGAGVVKAVAVPVDKVLEGTPIAGQAGTIKDYSRAKLGTGSTYVNALSVKVDSIGSVVFEPPTGYYTSGLNSLGFGSLIYKESNLVPVNIMKGKNIFGVAGTAPRAKAGWFSFNLAPGASFVEYVININLDWIPGSLACDISASNQATGNTMGRLTTGGWDNQWKVWSTAPNTGVYSVATDLSQSTLKISLSNNSSETKTGQVSYVITEAPWKAYTTQL